MEGGRGVRPDGTRILTVYRHASDGEVTMTATAAPLTILLEALL